MARPTRDDIEFARRHRRQKRRSAPALCVLRIAELNRLFSARWGDHLPDDDAGRADAVLMLHHLARLARDTEHRMRSWLAARAPWLSEDEAAELITGVLKRPLKFRADTLAARLGLTDAERAALRITTIGAIDVTAEQRKERRRERSRARKEAIRRANGALPRAEWLGLHQRPATALEGYNGVAAPCLDHQKT